MHSRDVDPGIGIPKSRDCISPDPGIVMTGIPKSRMSKITNCTAKCCYNSQEKCVFHYGDYQSRFNRFPAYVLSGRSPADYIILQYGLFLVTEAPLCVTAGVKRHFHIARVRLGCPKSQIPRRDVEHDARCRQTRV